MKKLLKALAVFGLALLLLAAEAAGVTLFSAARAVRRDTVSALVRQMDISALTAELLRGEDEALRALLASPPVEEYLYGYAVDCLLGLLRDSMAPPLDGRALKAAILDGAAAGGTALTAADLRELDAAVLEDAPPAPPDAETLGLSAESLRALRFLCGPWPTLLAVLLSLGLMAAIVLVCRPGWKGLAYCAAPTMGAGILFFALGFALLERYTAGTGAAAYMAAALGAGMKRGGLAAGGLSLALLLASSLIKALRQYAAFRQDAGDSRKTNKKREKNP